MMTRKEILDTIKTPLPMTKGEFIYQMVVIVVLILVISVYF